MRAQSRKKSFRSHATAHKKAKPYELRFEVPSRIELLCTVLQTVA